MPGPQNFIFPSLYILLCLFYPPLFAGPVLHFTVPLPNYFFFDAGLLYAFRDLHRQPFWFPFFPFLSFIFIHWPSPFLAESVSLCRC